MIGNGWVAAGLLAAVLAFAAVMAYLETTAQGVVGRRPHRGTDPESKIVATLQAEGFSVDEIAYALAADTDPRIVPVLVVGGGFGRVAKLPTLGVRLRSLSAAGLERGARKAAARELQVDPGEIILDIRDAP
ncbi:hypothetical protein DCE93_07010 [Agromyces badenianii]|uniref:Uncharacterized protein n=1 Tax=Agromyces badenianii TaxID=2080742 RepID=A0A2S0WVX0_9MICO|nr:hypothetical protein [Agromyces badenianii]AWB95440.1 hypothetical protein DCE93_07010 [Agromyces badenianii]PWC04291.1 hypothetical protein DCE94_09065 [Agromyces badenianii]